MSLNTFNSKINDFLIKNANNSINMLYLNFCINLNYFNVFSDKHFDKHFCLSSKKMR